MNKEQAIERLKVCLLQILHPGENAEIQIHTWNHPDAGLRISEISLTWTIPGIGISGTSYMQTDPPFFGFLFIAERYLAALMYLDEESVATAHNLLFYVLTPSKHGV